MILIILMKNFNDIELKLDRVLKENYTNKTFVKEIDCNISTELAQYLFALIHPREIRQLETAINLKNE
jgi:hypothetical protein